MPHDVDEPSGSSQSVPDTKKIYQPWSGLGLVFRLNKFLNSERDMSYLYTRHSAIAQTIFRHALGTS